MFWYNKENLRRKKFLNSEFDKLMIKSLIFNRSFRNYSKIYFFFLFKKFNKFSSISFLRRYCVIMHNSRSVFKHFKMVRHQCRYYASNGYFVGLRKASF